MAKVKLTRVRSGIGPSERHRGTLRALGLGRIAVGGVGSVRVDRVCGFVHQRRRIHGVGGCRLARLSCGLLALEASHGCQSSLTVQR